MIQAAEPLKTASPAGALVIDEACFHPTKVTSFRHRMADHPLLRMESLLELARRHEPKGLIRYHAGNVDPGTSFEDAPKNHATGLSVMETLSDMERSGSWVAFHYLHKDPVYRRLVEEILEQVRPLVEHYERKMANYTGWIFVTSPGGVTPFHLDHEHNFLMQVRGRKKLSVWDPANREVVSHQALELFHSSSSRKEVVYRDEYQASAHEFDAVPGSGVYMPSTAPHWVKNGDEVSVTLSLTFITESTRRKETIYTANRMLRLRGVDPTPCGASRWSDGLKSGVVGPYLAAKRALRLAPPQPYLIQDRG